MICFSRSVTNFTTKPTTIAMFCQPDGLLFYSAEATEARECWTSILNETSTLFSLYQSLLIFYLKAIYRSQWKGLVKRDLDVKRTVLEVIDEIGYQRCLLLAVGATEELFDLVLEIREGLEVDPMMFSKREEFCKLLIGLTETFPVTSLRCELSPPDTAQYRYFSSIEPRYYQTQRRIRHSGNLIWELSQRFIKASADENARIQALSKEEYFKEKAGQAGIPEDADSSDEWETAIFKNGERPEKHRKRILADIDLVRASKKMKKMAKELEEELAEWNKWTDVMAKRKREALGLDKSDDREKKVRRENEKKKPSLFERIKIKISSLFFS